VIVVVVVEDSESIGLTLSDLREEGSTKPALLDMNEEINKLISDDCLKECKADAGMVTKECG
jgi:hypothetical protein